MGIGPDELRLFSEFGDMGKRCAILGDCVFWYDGGSKEDFKNKMGFDVVDTFDILGSPTHKLDLNEEIPDKFHQNYDCVLDMGTLYSMFDVSMGFKNILLMLKKDGVVFHETNLSGHFNRGFYCLSPSLLNEFYACNGFEVLKMGFKIKKDDNTWKYIPTNNNELKGLNIHGDTSLMCFAKRKNILEFNKPVPNHYIMEYKK
tara:strand:- start:1407 stop:2012 length:606 start_codon:yes stop_codon:yes gene_type:complete